MDEEKLRRREILTQNRSSSSSRKYRSTTEIMHDILQTARNDGNGAGKTKIMYNASLSYNQVKEYLTILIDNGLLQHNLGAQKFQITEKGVNFLRLCDKLGDLIESPINHRS